MSVLKRKRYLFLYKFTKRFIRNSRGKYAKTKFRHFGILNVYSLQKGCDNPLILLYPKIVQGICKKQYSVRNFAIYNYACKHDSRGHYP